METISSILQEPPVHFNHPLFVFKKCLQAAHYNAQILERNDYNLDQVIRRQHPSQLSYGSEFRPTGMLEGLLRDHPLWNRLKEILDNGASFPLDPIADEIRRIDLSYHQDRGNHQALKKYASYIDPVIEEEIDRGFALPLPINCLSKLPKASLAPLGCHKQTTISESGDLIPKYRLTHDQSFPGPSGLSVNSRVQREKLPPIMYSFALLRIIHFIVHARQHYPSTRIYICKVDLDAAYRRCNMASTTSLESLTIYEDLLLVALRLTFGGSPCPSLWGIISETIADIANTLLHNPFWNHNELSDSVSDLIDPPLPLPDDVPFHASKELSVSLPENSLGYVDIFIDDNIGVVLDIDDNAKRLQRAIPLAIHTIARPLDPEDVIPRKDIISLKKYSAEGRLEETKKVLGWILNSRTLQISLPPDKYTEWSRDIRLLLTNKKTCHKQLETLVGRINHVAGILQPLRHYMGRLYQALHRSKTKHGWTQLRQSEMDDLRTILQFLDKAHKGISMNLLVFRQPTVVFRSDASEFGIGGYNLTSGIAWRFELPLECRLRSSLNSLEFLACLVSIWIDSFHQTIEAESCILSQTDSTSALGWLRKSNFADKSDEHVQLSTARKLADIILDNESCLYSQWFPGESNVIADSLSRDFHIPNSQLSHLLASHFPDQAPFGLQILPVPPNIVSWLTCLLLSQPQELPWSKEPTRSRFALGLASKPTSGPSESKETHSSIPSPASRGLRYLAPSPTPSEKAAFVMDHVVKPSSQSPSDPPWTAFHRSLSWLTELTQDLTEMGSLHCFYNANSEDIGHQTLPHDHRWR
jgi:hypothetical protein